MILFRIGRRELLALAASLSMSRGNMAAAEAPNAIPLQPEKLAEDLKRIGAWIEKNVPPRFFPIYRQPASVEEITQAERRVGVGFHPHLRILLSSANGATDNSPSLVNTFSLMSADEIVSAYEFLSAEFPDGRNIEHPDHAPIDAAPGIRSTWWWPKWIPFMANGGGDYLCVDMDPAPGGNSGQVVIYYHDETFRSKEAPDIGQMFARIADGLETGTYTFDSEGYMIVEKS